MPKHILVLIHGITPEVAPRPTEQYEKFLEAFAKAKLPFEAPIRVSWGVEVAGVTPRPDQRLTPAEAFVGSLVSESALPPGDAGGFDWGLPVLRQAIRAVRESVVLYGLSDAIYYAAPDGERAVRNAVFGQVFEKLDVHAADEVELHIVAHSLGVTVAHDFLYALFGDSDPFWPADSNQPTDLAPALLEQQKSWRQAAKDKRLRLGTFISFASQLPLFMMRKRAIVDMLAAHRKLDPSVIGVDPTRQTPQWVIFYDSDELLGFATKPLYEHTRAIQDIHVNSGLEPLGAHLGYWKSDTIIQRCLELLQQNTR